MLTLLVLQMLAFGSITPASLLDPVVRVDFTPNSIRCEEGSRGPVRTVVYRRSGAIDPSTTVAFFSKNSTVASVTSTGRQTARVACLAPGKAFVGSKYRKIRDSTLTVVDPVCVSTVASSLAINPDSVIFAIVGDTTTTTATVINACGKADTTLSVVWSTHDFSVTTASSTGTQRALVTAVGVGATMLTASIGSLKDSIKICVGGTAVRSTPETLALTIGATGDLAGSASDCSGALSSTIAWKSRALGVATVASSGPQSAVVTGVGAGSAYIVDSIGAAKDSSLITVTAAPGVPGCTGTNVAAGASIQTAVTAGAVADTFCLLAGVHRMQQVTPKANQVFLGAGSGVTVLNGSKVLTGWTVAGANWMVGGQTQSAFHKTGWQCLPTTHPLCYESEILYLNDSLYIRVGSLAAIGPGKWYFDEAGDRIYINENPAGKIIETTVTPYAFAGSAAGVSVKYLTVMRYANSNGYGAIGYQSSGANWVIQSVLSKENHGSGIDASAGWDVLGSTMHKNGQMGYTCGGANVLFEDDTISYNNWNGNTAGVGGEAGAGKCVRSDGLTIRNTFSHHNKGPGLWTDIDNINTLYENNRVEDNDWRGIFHEISYAATIRNNIVRRNGFATPFETPSVCDRAGIMISNSPNVQVYGNFLEDNFHGITGFETDRGSGAHGPLNVTNLDVHDNTVIQTDDGVPGGICDSDPNSDPYAVSANNRWAKNIYECGASTRWRWNNAVKTKPQWLALPQDVGATFSGC